jgi:fructose-1,6-bisphosphatase/sedoheptulose 1,7-bisphosphatase-like protein
MKSQKHNEGELAELKVKIEKDIVKSVKIMADNSGMSVEEIVVIALKRFRAHHADYMGDAPKLES